MCKGKSWYKLLTGLRSRHHQVIGVGVADRADRDVAVGEGPAHLVEADQPL